MKKNKRGLTLLELVVVIAIIGIAIAIALPNYRRFQDRQILKNAAQLLAMDLKSQKQRANTLSSMCGVVISAPLDGEYQLYEKREPDDNSGPSVSKGEITKTVRLQRLFRRNILLGTSLPLSINFYPQPGGGEITESTIALSLGGKSIYVEVQSDGEIEVKEE